MDRFFSTLNKRNCEAEIIIRPNAKNNKCQLNYIQTKRFYKWIQEGIF